MTNKKYNKKKKEKLWLLARRERSKQFIRDKINNKSYYKAFSKIKEINP
jgi:hypothetical protein